MNTFEMQSRPLRYFIKYQPRAFCLGIFFLLLTNGLDSIYPLFLKWGLDLIQQRAPQNEVLWSAIAFFAVLSGLAWTRYAWRSYFGYFHTAGAEHLRQTLFAKLLSLSARYFQKTPVGDLISLATNDVQAFRNAIGSGLLIFLDGIIIMCFVLPIMITLNPDWAWKTLIALPLLPFLTQYVMKKVYKAYKEQQDDFAELTALTQETVGGIRVIKSFAQENFRTELYNKISKKYEKSSNKAAIIDAFFNPLMEFGIASGSVILIFLAADGVIEGTVTVGTFVAYHRYIQKMVWPMSAIGYGLSMMQKGFASFSRIKDFLNQDSEILDQGKEDLQVFESIEFNNVSFQYPDSTTWALKNISFQLLAGEKLGVIGAVGSGKSTLLSLIVRLYNPQQGQIFINNKPIENYTLSSLRKNFLIVPQESFLFSDTVAENLSFANPKENFSTELSALEKVSTSVGMHEEILKLPQQYFTLLGERGVNLSGGQKQRLTIARALLAQPQVLIMDDSLSAIDTKTEKQIQQELHHLHKHITTQIIVSHRLSSIQNMNRLLVLNEGRLEAFGSFNDLILSSPTLIQWVQLQNNNQEGL